jgi:DNA modification methylase
MTVRQLVGDCRVQLAMLGAGLVQCCVSSPPYWGLRDYGTPPLVWGGDAEHAHEWSAAHTAGWHVGTATGVASSTLARGAAEAQARNKTAITGKSMGSVCPCGAWLGSLGLEPTPELYVGHVVECFRHVRRVLRDDGTLWVNLGDSYAGSGKGPSGSNGVGGQSERQGWEGSRRTGTDKSDSNRGSQKYALVNGGKPAPGLKSKDLLMIPFRVAMALQADGWYLRSVIPWLKRNSMPESVQGSRFKRHRITIDEYERLSGMRYAGERADAARSGYVPSMRSREVPDCETSLSAKSEGTSDREGARAASGGEGVPPPSQQLTAGTEEQGEVRSDREGPRDSHESDYKVQEFRTRQSETARTRRAAEAPTGLAGVEEGSGSTLAEVAQGTDLASGDGPAPSGIQGCKHEQTDNRRVAPDPPAASKQMFLLQEEVAAADNGSRHTAQPGRGALQRERGACLPVMQFEEEQPPDDALVDCPGCEKCSPNDGYILHLSAGRPSSSVEYVFLLSKRERYYWDAAAVRIDGQLWSTKKPDGWDTGPGGHNTIHRNGREQGVNTGEIRNGRNRRNGDWFFESWQGLMLDEQDDPLGFVVNPAPFKNAHYATFPPKLVEPMVKASTRPGDVILDPFGGAGTVGLVADRLGRNAVLVDLKPEYGAMAVDRLTGDAPMFVKVNEAQA